MLSNVYIYIYIHIHVAGFHNPRTGKSLLNQPVYFFLGLLLRTLENELAETLKRSLRFPDFDSQNSPKSTMKQCLTSAFQIQLDVLCPNMSQWLSVCILYPLFCSRCSQCASGI